jgi:hypothetical protein
MVVCLSEWIRMNGVPARVLAEQNLLVLDFADIPDAGLGGLFVVVATKAI